MYWIIEKVGRSGELSATGPYGSIKELCSEESLNPDDREVIVIEVHLDGSITVGWLGEEFADE